MMTRRSRSLALIARTNLIAASSAGRSPVAHFISGTASSCRFDPGTKPPRLRPGARSHSKTCVAFKPAKKTIAGIVTWFDVHGLGLPCRLRTVTPDEMKYDHIGYLLPEYVSSRPTPGSKTSPIQAAGAGPPWSSAFQALKAGTWIKVTMPMVSRAESDGDPRRWRSGEAAAAPQDRRGGPACCDEGVAAAPLASIAASWTLSLTSRDDISRISRSIRMANSLSGTCMVGPMPFRRIGGEDGWTNGVSSCRKQTSAYRDQPDIPRHRAIPLVKLDDRHRSLFGMKRPSRPKKK